MATFPPVSIRCANCNNLMQVKAPTKEIKSLRCAKCGHITPVVTIRAIPKPPPTDRHAQISSLPTSMEGVPAHPAPEASLPTQMGDMPTQMDSIPTRLDGVPTQQESYGELEVVVDPQTSTQRFQLRPGVHIIGREAAAGGITIHTQDLYLSRQHCTLEVRRLKQGGLGYLLSDGVTLPDGTHKPSANGTIIVRPGAGAAITEHRLVESEIVFIGQGYLLRLGYVTLRLHLPTPSN